MLHLFALGLVHVPIFYGGSLAEHIDIPPLMKDKYGRNKRGY